MVVADFLEKHKTFFKTIVLEPHSYGEKDPLAISSSDELNSMFWSLLLSQISAKEKVIAGSHQRLVAVLVTDKKLGCLDHAKTFPRNQNNLAFNLRRALLSA